MTSPVETETTHRGVTWRREADGSISFFDSSGDQWVRWAPGVDAPPLPPGWGSQRSARAGWKSRWRLIPLVITVVAVGIAVFQVLRPSASQITDERNAAEAMFGRCLAQHGTAYGHPRYSSAPVSCASSLAAVKVVEVLPTSPGRPACPTSTVAVELAIYAGVRYPHVECVQPVRP